MTKCFRSHTYGGPHSNLLVGRGERHASILPPGYPLFLPAAVGIRFPVRFPPILTLFFIFPMTHANVGPVVVSPCHFPLFGPAGPGSAGACLRLGAGFPFCHLTNPLIICHNVPSVDSPAFKPTLHPTGPFFLGKFRLTQCPTPLLSRPAKKLGDKLPVSRFRFPCSLPSWTAESARGVPNFFLLDYQTAAGQSFVFGPGRSQVFLSPPFP